MKVNYKVLEYIPEAEWIAVEFTHPDRPDEQWVKQFEFPDFTRAEKLMDHIRAVASRIAGQWERIPDHPAQLVIPETGQVDVVPELYLPYEPNPELEPEPEYDIWTQRVEQVDVSADPYAMTIPWNVIELTKEEQDALLDHEAEMLRQERNYALMQSDFIFSPDVNLSTEKKAEWCEYRQKLRDLTTQPNFPKDVDWPQKPTGC